MKTRDSFGTMERLECAEGAFAYFSLPKLYGRYPGLARYPRSIKILLESLLRNENGREVTKADIEAFLRYDPAKQQAIDIPFMPARVLLQDFTGVPCVVDLAAMREEVKRRGKDPGLVNPQVPVDLVIDHSIQVDFFGTKAALGRNEELEFQRNRERYEFIRWGQAAFDKFRVIPPGAGICHQVNLEYLARVVREAPGSDGLQLAFPDTVVGTDSHTPMVNGLGVVGWGVGGIEAEAVMLGQPMYMLIPTVVGVRLHGRLGPGVTATDLVLTLTALLRKKGVVGAFVEFFGDGLSSMSVPDRATLSNMAPEYGATIGYFPIDDATLDYLAATGRPREVVEAYSKAQGLFREKGEEPAVFGSVVELDLASVEPSVAGPKRPQDRVPLAALKKSFRASLTVPVDKGGYGLGAEAVGRTEAAICSNGSKAILTHGSVVIASITSCTNTSNPTVMVAAGLLARRAVALGLRSKPWVKTSLAPGSLVVTDYLERAGLLDALETLGFAVAGYGCMTCIGNSGPLPEGVAAAVDGGNLVAASVLSGNRNFEGRVHPKTRANFLASPPLVVAAALAGRIDIDFSSEPVGEDSDGRPVYLKDLWPQDEEVARVVAASLDPAAFAARYEGVEAGNPGWNSIPLRGGRLFSWDRDSTYIQEPPFLAGEEAGFSPLVRGARVLVMVGDSITTDHISPAGDIDESSPAGRYLKDLGVDPSDFNSYGSRRGNDRVMSRGTFANPRLRNRLAPGTEGSFTTCFLDGRVTDIHDAAESYRKAGVSLLVVAGKDYGMGSSRDWAAKGVRLLGVVAVMAESFERIHRSNLVGMGVIPLEFVAGQSAGTLGLTGAEAYRLEFVDGLAPRARVRVLAEGDGRRTGFDTLMRVDTAVEVDYIRDGGILKTVLGRLIRGA